MIIFESILTTFEASTIFKAAGAVVEISSSLQNSNPNQVKLAQIGETHCRSSLFALFKDNITADGEIKDCVVLNFKKRYATTL